MANLPQITILLIRPAIVHNGVLREAASSDIHWSKQRCFTIRSRNEVRAIEQEPAIMGPHYGGDSWAEIVHPILNSGIKTFMVARLCKWSKCVFFCRRTLKRDVCWQCFDFMWVLRWDAKYYGYMSDFSAGSMSLWHFISAIWIITQSVQLGFMMRNAP